VPQKLQDKCFSYEKLGETACNDKISRL
jgi:hypothetical protein